MKQKGFSEILILIAILALLAVGYLLLKNLPKPSSSSSTTPSSQAPSPSSPEGKFCGGIAANLPENQCPKGYQCKVNGDHPDAGGKCVKE